MGSSICFVAKLVLHSIAGNFASAFAHTPPIISLVKISSLCCHKQIILLTNIGAMEWCPSKMTLNELVIF